MSLGEFELIRAYFARVAEASSDASVILGLGDDCALLQPPVGQQLAVSIDTLVEGTHFLPGTPADKLASRLFGSALSDLAAMGATPAWLTLALSLPEANSDWLQAFSQQLCKLCLEYEIALVGGDTTRGPLALSAQVHGFVSPGQALCRKGARPGDLICVSGTLGDSRGGLEGLLQQADADPEMEWLWQRFYAPTPRVALGKCLHGLATSCIDISDGLLADLGHILAASGGLGAQLQVEQLPISDALISRYGEAQARQWALSGGEDFELCFTLPAGKRASLPEGSRIIGQITAEPRLELLLHGEPYTSSTQGYDHFQNNNQDLL